MQHTNQFAELVLRKEKGDLPMPCRPHEHNYHKPQRFVFRNGIPLEEDSDTKTPKVCHATRLQRNDMFNYNAAPVLTFGAFYGDSLGEGFKSTTRYRKCNVLYFLDDDEMKIYEPPQKNSGMPQGCIVSKGKFIKPEGGFYTINDLNIGETLFVNGREYKLINCDSFTRKFLTEMGFRLRSPQPDPIDPITEDRNEINAQCSYRKPYIKDYKVAAFLKNHPKRLRFYGVYGEDKKLFEEERECTLYYDLAQGTIKLVEERNVNRWIDGRFDTRVLLRPTKVPKRLVPSLPPGEMADQTLLNLAHDIQNVLIGGKYYKIQNPDSHLVDSNPLEGRKRDVEYYKDTDLDLGVPLNIFGFRVFLYDCDEFTKNYYKGTYNKELQPVPRKDEEVFHTHKLVYKHEEFGPPEQTLRTNDPFKPRQYNVDLLKFFKNDRSGYNVRQLKFLARVITEDPVEKLHRFVVCFFMEDDTLAIRGLDLDHQNKSAMEHAHLKRMKVVKPHSTYWNSGRNFYEPVDMYVGSVIYIRGKPFELLEADEYTYDYMEQHCDKFPLANIRKIMTELKEWITPKCGSLKSGFEKFDPCKTGFIAYENFRNVLYEEMPSEIQSQYPEHALKTVARYYAYEKYTGLCLDELISKAQSELYRKKFYDFEDLKLAFKIHDSGKSGYLDPDRTYYVMRTTSIPLDRDLLKSFIHKFPKKDNKINYSDLVNNLNWLENPAEFDKGEPQAIQINWERNETERDLEKIKYNCFMMDIVSS